MLCLQRVFVAWVRACGVAKSDVTSVGVERFWRGTCRMSAAFTAADRTRWCWSAMGGGWWIAVSRTGSTRGTADFPQRFPAISGAGQEDRRAGPAHRSPCAPSAEDSARLQQPDAPTLPDEAPTRARPRLCGGFGCLQQPNVPHGRTRPVDAPESCPQAPLRTSRNRPRLPHAVEPRPSPSGLGCGRRASSWDHQPPPADGARALAHAGEGVHQQWPLAANAPRCLRHIHRTGRDAMPRVGRHPLRRARRCGKSRHCVVVVESH